jgi:hypothetical protein
MITSITGFPGSLHATWQMQLSGISLIGNFFQGKH